MWRLRLFVTMGFAMTLIVGAAIIKAEEPVNPLTQCHAYVGVVIKQRDAAMADLATHAAKLEEVTKEKQALEQKIKDLEGKKAAK